MLRNFSNSGPGMEFKSRPLKHSCSEIRRTVNNSCTLGKQNIFIFTKPFISYQEKGTGPLN